MEKKTTLYKVKHLSPILRFLCCLYTFTIFPFCAADYAVLSVFISCCSLTFLFVWLEKHIYPISKSIFLGSRAMIYDKNVYCWVFQIIFFYYFFMLWPYATGGLLACFQSVLKVLVNSTTGQFPWRVTRWEVQRQKKELLWVTLKTPEED